VVVTPQGEEVGLVVEVEVDEVVEEEETTTKVETQV
jgi:hypothetical protein